MLFRVEFEWCVEQGEAEPFVARLKGDSRNHDLTSLDLPNNLLLSTVQIEPCDVGGYQFVRAIYRVAHVLPK